MSGRLYVVDPRSSLYRLDSATGSARVVGSVGIANVTDIAFHGPTLYGVTFSDLLRLDPTRGAGTTIGPIGFTTNALAVASDGTLYGATTGGDLITINPVTGTGTLVGNFGGGLTSSGDLIFDTNDVLFGALNQAGSVVLARIDRTSGVATVIGPTGLPTVYGLAFLDSHLFAASEAGELAHINVATGGSTVVGTNGLTQWGLAARPCCC